MKMTQHNIKKFGDNFRWCVIKAAQQYMAVAALKIQVKRVRCKILFFSNYNKALNTAINERIYHYLLEDVRGC